MPVVRGVGQSEHSDDKRRDHLAILRMHTAIVKAVQEKHPWYSEIYHYIDVTAGPGQYNERLGDTFTGPGSPVLACEALAEAVIPFSAAFIEQDPAIAQRLSDALCMRPELMGYAGSIRVSEGDFREKLPPLARYFLDDKHSLGLVYCDPTCNLVETYSDLATCLQSDPRFRFLDVLLYVPATGIKRAKHVKHKDLGDLLAAFHKTSWLIRHEQGQYQWTFLYGSNCPTGDYRRYRFYDLTSDAGRDTWDHVSLTVKELQNRRPKPGYLF